MIKKLSIALLVLCSLCLVGCNDVDGGPNSHIVRHYNSDNIAEYKIFYDTFCEYNEERYLMPESNGSIKFTYFFDCMGISREIKEKGDRVDYISVGVYFEIEKITDYLEAEIFDGEKLGFQACNIADKYDYVFSHLSEIGYRINNPDNEDNQSISIIIGDIEIACKSIGVTTFTDDENFNTVMDKIISAYKGGL